MQKHLLFGNSPRDISQPLTSIGGSRFSRNGQFDTTGKEGMLAEPPFTHELP